MHTVSVGILLPTSSIRPMSKQFLRAFKKASSEVLEGTNYELEVLTEMIGTGSPKDIDRALDQFFGFHDVDVITGIATRYGLQHSFDRFQKNKVPFVVCGLGEHLIPTQGYNEHVFVNSIHLWQQNWCLGYYAGKNLGNKGMVFSSMYDSGYSFLPAIQQGAAAANPEGDLTFKLMPMTEPGQLSPIIESFDQVDFEGQDYIFSLLCGEEATIFLEEFKKRGLHENTKLLGMPFLLEPGEADLSGVSVYSSHYQLDQAGEDPQFKNVFTDLGASTGIAVAQAIIKGNGELDKDVVAEALAETDEHKVHASGSFPKLKVPIGIVKHVFEKDNVLRSDNIDSQTIDLDEDETLNIARDEVSSCWVNPYLAI